MKCKKILAVLMATILFCGGLPAFSSLAADTTVNGDVNSDVTIDVRDLIRLKKYCASSNVDINISQSDWNGDGKINSDDVTRLRNWLVNPTEENAFVGLPSLFSTGNGTLTVTNTDSFPEVAFTNNNNENAYITIDDSCFKNEVTEYDSICFKVKYSTSGYLNATGLSVSVVTNDDIVIKTATSLDKNEEFDIRLSKEEMAIYKSNSNGIRIKLTATKTAIIGSYKYDLTLSDFCVVDEMNRFSCQKTEDVVYGTMGPAYDLQKSQYPFVAATYENDRWQRWSYVTIMDDDYIKDITKYDMLEFDVKIKTPMTGEFDSVQLDMLYGSDSAKLKNSIAMKYDTWYHVSLTANEMYKYKTSGADLKLLLTVNGGAEDVNLLQMGYELCIDNFRLVENGNKAAFNNAETMFAHWQQTTERTVDLLEGPIVTGSNANEFGADFYYAGAPHHGTMDKNYVDGERTVVRITRTATTDLWQGTAKFYIPIPEDMTLNKFSNFSMDAWFSDYAHPWTSVRLVTADKQLVTNLQSKDWASTKNSWQSMQWSVGNFTLQGDYTLQDAKYFEIRVNLDNDVNHAIEVRLDNLKVSEGKYSVVNHTTTSSLLSLSDTINGRDDVVAKYVNTSTADIKINVNDRLFKEGLTAEDSVRFWVYVDPGTNTGLTDVSVGLVCNSVSQRYQNNLNVPLNQWTMITIPKWGMNKYVADSNGLTMYIVSNGTKESYTMYITDVEILKFANKDIDQLVTADYGYNGKVVSTSSLNCSLFTGKYASFTNGTWDGYSKVIIDDTHLKEEIEPGDTLECWVRLGGAQTHNGTATVKLTTRTNDNALGSSETQLSLTSGEWVRLTLDAEAVQKYLTDNNGLRLQTYRADAGASFGFTFHFGAFSVVKKIDLPEASVTTIKETLVADESVVHGVYNSVSAKYINGYWDAWSNIAVDDSSFKDTITKYDSIEFWAYVTGGQSTVEKISLGVVSENNEARIKNNVTLTKNGWTHIRLTPAEVATYMATSDGMKFTIAAEGTNVMSQGGTDYTLYIDEFRVVANGNYDEVSALELYSCTNTSLMGNFAADYDMVRGTDNRCSAAFSNNRDSRWSFITIDDSTFKDNVISETVIEFWVYLKPSTASGCTYTSITLAVGTNSEQAVILNDQTLTFDEWTKISISGDAIGRYLQKQNGLRLRMTVNGGSNMSYTLYLEDFRVIQPTDSVKGSLDLVDVYVASSADKILQNEDCSYLGKDFVLNTFKNEYESGQLILSADEDIAGFMVSATDFTNGSTTLSADNFEIYTEYYHAVEEIFEAESIQEPGMYPDALLPIETASEYGMNRITAGENQGIWIAVKVPATQAAGTYQGNFVITLGYQKKYIPAQITVADYTLPNKVSLQSCIPIQWGYLSNAEMTSSKEMYKKYVDLLNKFRLSGQYVITRPMDPDGNVRGRTEAEASLDYATKDSCSSYAIRVVETQHDTYGKVLNQTLFESYLKAYIDVSIENNVDLFAKAYVYMGNICDEPTPGIGDERAQYCAGQFNSAVANAVTYLEGKTGNTTFLSQLKKSLQSLQNVVTADARNSLSDVNTYCPMIDAFDSSANMSDKATEDNYWWYTCTQPKIPYPTYHIDDEAASARIMGWLAKESGVKGYLTWEMIYTIDATKNSSVVRGTELYDNVHRWGDAYGDGFLVYPGRIFGLDRPVESLRLYAMGDGMEDYEALTDLIDTYEELAEKYNTDISSDGILEFLYDMLADNTRVYGDGIDIASVREVLTQLLLLAKNEGTAVSDFAIENGIATYRLVTKDGVTQGTYTFEAMTASFTSNSVSTTSNISATAGTTSGATVKVTLSGLMEYDVKCDMPTGVVTSDVDKMYLTVYNNASVPLTLTVYSNKTEQLDTFTLQPGKNILSFAHMNRLAWFPRKGMDSINFKVVTPNVSQTNIELGSITVMKK